MRSWSSSVLLLLLVGASCLADCQAHSRWKCPTPRSPSTGIKTGPCGRQTNDFSYPDDLDLPAIAPGPLFVRFEESIFHTGSPFRISLSGDGKDDNVCVLLDHVPHNDGPNPFPQQGVESTYVQYGITIQIPNVKCDRCSLHLGNPMTEILGPVGSPTGQGCTDPFGTCSSVYYSCTLPFRITGEQNYTSSEFTCPDPLPSDWPQQWFGDRNERVDTSVPGVYRREAGIWRDGLLESIPGRYRNTTRSACDLQVDKTTPSSNPPQIPSPTEALTMTPTITSPTIPKLTSAPSFTLAEFQTRT